MFGILQWHVWYAPQWLVTLTWNLERAAARYFSAGMMLRTLVSHWHKDAVSYRQGTLGKITLALAWNMISRAIGLTVRTIVLVLYFVTALCIAVLGLVFIALFLLWPLLAAGSISLGVRALIG